MNTAQRMNSDPVIERYEEEEEEEEEEQEVWGEEGGAQVECMLG